MGGAAKMLEPLYDLMKTLILLCGTIHTDDTSVKARDSERKIKAMGRLWIYWDDFRYPAVLFSVVSSCQRHGHDPFAYLRDVLGRLLGLPKDRLGELLPDRWSPPKAAEATAAAGSVQSNSAPG
jgi:hypothetical protein